MIWSRVENFLEGQQLESMWLHIEFSGSFFFKKLFVSAHRSKNYWYQAKDEPTGGGGRLRDRGREMSVSLSPGEKE